MHLARLFCLDKRPVPQRRRPGFARGRVVAGAVAPLAQRRPWRSAPAPAATAGRPRPQPAAALPARQRKPRQQPGSGTASAAKANGKQPTKPLWRELTPGRAAGAGAAGRQMGHHQRRAKAQVAGAVAELPQAVRGRTGQAAQPHERMGGPQPPAAHPGAPELRRDPAVVARRQEGQVGGLPGPAARGKEQAGRQRGQAARHRRGREAGAAGKAGHRSPSPSWATRPPRHSLRPRPRSTPAPRCR